jgi:CDP-diglyceride synthetase
VRFLLVFVPVLGAPILHGPVLALDLLRPLKRPIDGGRNVLGDNKTWRGALLMTLGVVLAAALLSRWDGYWSELPHGVRDAGPWAFGALLGLGVVLGELPNSFLKRRLGVGPGRRRGGLAGAALVALDQGDLVLGAWLLLAPVWTMAVWQAAVAFAVVSAVHLVVNVVGYAVGARRSPI